MSRALALALLLTAGCSSAEALDVPTVVGLNGHAAPTGSRTLLTLRHVTAPALVDGERRRVLYVRRGGRRVRAVELSRHPVQGGSPAARTDRLVELELEGGPDLPPAPPSYRLTLGDSGRPVYVFRDGRPVRVGLYWGRWRGAPLLVDLPGGGQE